MDLKQSKLWDHEKSLEELLKPIDQVYLDLHYTNNKGTDSYGLIVMLIPHENDDGFTEIGITNDGFVYNGDAYYGIKHQESLHSKFPSIVEVEKELAINILLAHKEYMNAGAKLEFLLTGIKNARYDCVIRDIRESHA